MVVSAFSVESSLLEGRPTPHILGSENGHGQPREPKNSPLAPTSRWSGRPAGGPVAGTFAGLGAWVPRNQRDRSQGNGALGLRGFYFVSFRRRWVFFLVLWKKVVFSPFFWKKVVFFWFPPKTTIRAVVFPKTGAVRFWFLKNQCGFRFGPHQKEAASFGLSHKNVVLVG